ncbi:hypothetical protein PYCC9005_004282 [Savitreella phatthalungensis]
MSTRQDFVQLRDLSPPSGSSGTAYMRASLEDQSFAHDAEDNESQSPIIGEKSNTLAHEAIRRELTQQQPHLGQPPDDASGGKPVLRRRKAWQDTHERKRVTRAGRFYQRIMAMGFIPRWLSIMIPIAILIAVPIIAGAFEPQSKIANVRIVWFFTWIEAVWLGLWAAKLVAKLVPYIFRFVVSVVSASTAKYAAVIKALEFPLTLFLWSIVSLSTFSPIMTQNPTQRAEGDTNFSHWESIVAKILTAAMLSSAVYLGERILVQLIAIHFHKTQYDMRITENKWAVNMLAKLLGHSRAMFPRFGGDFDQEDAMIEPAAFASLSRRGGLLAPDVARGGTRSAGNVTPMQFVNGARRVFQVGAGLVGNVAQEVRGDKFNVPGSPYQIVVESLLHQRACEALARRIWLSFVQEGNEALLPEDMLDVFGEGSREDAEAAFTYFDEDMNGDVSLDEVTMKILEVSKERKAISASLKDVDSAIEKLHNVLLVIVFIISVFIFIALLDTNFKTLLATSATTLLSLSFIFGTTCQEIMASLIFVFIKHPFDVSDRVVINNLQYVVQEMNLMFTILKRSDGTQVQAPNSLLNTLFIDNVRRSAAMLEVVSVSVDFGTSLDKIEALRNEMLDFVQRESRDFQRNFDITVADFADLGKLKLTMAISHKSNWQNDALRAQRRNKWMCALALAIKKLEIKAGGPSSGDPANPFVISQVESKALQATDPFATPANTAGGSGPSRAALGTDAIAPPEYRIDTTLGAGERRDEAFDVDLRSGGEAERLEARLPFTIQEETDILLADEEARDSRRSGSVRRRGNSNQQGNSYLPQFVSPAAAYSGYTSAAQDLPSNAQQLDPAGNGVVRTETMGSVRSTATGKARTGRRGSSQRSNYREGAAYGAPLRQENSGSSTAYRRPVNNSQEPPVIPPAIVRTVHGGANNDNMVTNPGYARTSGANAGPGAGGTNRI